MVSVSSLDQSAGHLYDKLLAGAGISIAIVNPGASEQLQISGVGGGTLTDISSGCALLNCTSGGPSVNALVSGKFCILYVYAQAVQITSSPFTLTIPVGYKSSGAMWSGMWTAPIYGADMAAPLTTPGVAQLAGNDTTILMYRDYSSGPFGLYSADLTTVDFTLMYMLA